MALVVPVVAVVCGLVVGGLAGERVVGRRRVAVVARPAGAAAAPEGTSGPIEQLRGVGTLLFTDQQGRAYAQAADRSGRRVLGQLGELAARRRPPGLDVEVAALLLAAAPDDRPAELAPDGDLVYLRTADGAATVGRLADGSLRRLVPAGWKSTGPPRHSADGNLLGVCGFRVGGTPFPSVTAARSWVLDGSGRRLATLPGCLYDVAGLGAAGRQALRRDRVALVFQGYGLVSLLTARENVELPFRVARRDPAAAAAAAGRWLAVLGLADRADQRTDQLSGGERQRVALARALAVEPAVLLVDEPTAELDEDNRDRAVGLLRDAADRGAAVVVATHDPEVVELCDRVVRLVDGRPVELDPDSVGGPVA
jgi:ABC-type lipoprotein export system ATPase subunit